MSKDEDYCTQEQQPDGHKHHAHRKSRFNKAHWSHDDTTWHDMCLPGGPNPHRDSWRRMLTTAAWGYVLCGRGASLGLWGLVPVSLNSLPGFIWNRTSLMPVPRTAAVTQKTWRTAGGEGTYPPRPAPPRWPDTGPPRTPSRRSCSPRSRTPHRARRTRTLASWKTSSWSCPSTSGTWSRRQTEHPVPGSLLRPYLVIRALLLDSCMLRFSFRGRVVSGTTALQCRCVAVTCGDETWSQTSE